MTEFCMPETNNSPVWSIFDVFVRKLVPPRFSGGLGHIQQFKDASLMHNKLFIRASAAKYLLPIALLAGVCWIEAGGDTNFIDRIAFEVRGFGHLGNLPTASTSPPTKTSFGWVSGQLKTAAVTLGLDPEVMTISQWRSLSNCLEQDVYNVDLAAKRLRMLPDHNGFIRLGMEEVRVIGGRYNRVASLSLEKINENTSYSDFIVKRWASFSRLVG